MAKCWLLHGWCLFMHGQFIFYLCGLFCINIYYIVDMDESLVGELTCQGLTGLNVTAARQCHGDFLDHSV